MRNAWHFYCALVLVIKVVCGDIGIALAHPLTRRYVFFQHQRIYWCWSLERQRQF
ncbi:DUF3265 domain-containing protein [Vibrio vulnificus]|nr:DUF3265 domain-containing protein [Vibrio vulnificus]NTJ40210.1 DUF3265 domain-containing protein [Vibrio vulnificus]